MVVTAGDHLGPYKILGAIGAGGMGEVYRALDSKLGREVAIKVLPEAFGRDPERLARFEREARILDLLSLSSYTISISSILYFQRNTTGAA